MLDLEFLMDSLSLSTLNTSCHCLLVSMASSEKSVFNLIESLLSIRHDEPLLSCCSRDSFFLLSFDYDLSVLLDYDLIIICVHFLNSSYLELFLLLLFSACWVISVFHRIWEVSSHYFFIPLFDPFSPLLLVLPLCIFCYSYSAPQLSDTLFIFLHFFFFSSNWIISTDLSQSSLIFFCCQLKYAVELL